MSRMVDAAVALLRERSADEITVRDVAERAGHHHRFVAAWFGGKVGLLTAAFERLAADAASTMRFPPERDGVAPDTVRAIKLMNWLIANDPTALDGRASTPLLDAVRRIYTSAGAADDEARLLAQRLVGFVVAAVLFPSPLGLREDDLARQVDLERALIAAYLTR